MTCTRCLFVLRELLDYFLFKIFFVKPKTGKIKTSTRLSVYTLKQKFKNYLHNFWCHYVFALCQNLLEPLKTY